MRRALIAGMVWLLPGVLPAQETAIQSAARAGHRAFREGAYTTAVYFLTDVVTAEPKHPSAWKDLCLAYLALDRVDAALDACRHQIDAHPETRYVYRALGQALLRNGQRDEAIAAYRRQLEQDPRDVSAYGELGNIYCDLGRYAEALPLLEKALALAPNYDVSQAGLGDAQLGLGHTEQGLAILSKLAQEQPTPGELNRVADILASHKVGLDLAQRYAESAVSVTASEMQMRAEQPVVPETLRLVVSLATYWDTLGRVYLQQGNPEADQFIAAAKRLRASHASVIPAGKLFAEKAAAEFSIAEAAKPALAAAEFIRGDQRLLPFATAVRNGVPPGLFPQAVPAKIPRRANLVCPGQGGDCSIELLSASAALYAELNAAPPRTQLASNLVAGPIGVRGGLSNRNANVSHPVPIYRIEPEYSEEARKNGLEGIVVLRAEVDSDGLPRNIQVVRGLGMGLDEKAVEAVSQWKFRPGTKDGQPATLPVTIEVNFRLLKHPPRQ